MNVKQISAIIILACMLLLSACGEYKDEIEYTYPEYSLEEETTTAIHHVENSEIMSESEMIESITSTEKTDETDPVETDSSNTDDSHSENTENEVSETEFAGSESLETESVETEMSDSSTETVSDSSTEETSDVASVESKETEAVETEPKETESRPEETETETKSPHTDTLDENGYCDICGEKIEPETSNGIESSEAVEETTEETATASSALFDKFYDNNFDTTATKHSDGGKMTEKTDTYTVGGYELKFINYLNVYKNARDAKGNPALKVGKSTEAGSFEIHVPSNISTVVFKVAKYKDHESRIKINDVEYVLTKNSNDGEYDIITINTKNIKTIKFETTEAYKVCMIRSIEFVK